METIKSQVNAVMKIVSYYPILYMFPLIPITLWSVQIRDFSGLYFPVH